MEQALDEDWELLLELFPVGWEQTAVLSGALERLRGFASARDLLRVLLLHVGRGYSLRESAVRARQAGLADISDVAILKRLRKAGEWWRQLCVALLRESGFAIRTEMRGWKVRAMDGTLIKEPGPGGGLWRVHYSLLLPELECDHLELTPLKGPGTGEKLERFPAAAGDLMLADRGYCRSGSIAALHRQGAAVIVRLNTSTLPLLDAGGKRFPLLKRLQRLGPKARPVEWRVWIRAAGQPMEGRLCAIRKSEQSAQRARRKMLRRSQRSGSEPKPETLAYTGYILVFTTLPASQFTAAEVLEWYRLRWQIELVFKRLKSLAGIGHLPKYDERSARGWLFGKLLLALLGQKLMRLGRDISPWGYPLPPDRPRQRLATV
jgi:hypothetical protein